ncbi:MAG TPA: hypothetical protein DCX92_11305 [Bacteroidetes bacterium]|nr:hypothetical protein [Bacteroidota bacterium]
MNISELHLFTGSVSSLKKFYSDVLGLEITALKNDKIEIKVGSTGLIFIEEPGSNPYYHYAINIPHNQISGAIEWLGSKVNLIEYNGSPIIDFPNWNAHSVYFYDPAGNIIELIARHDLENASDEPFSPESLLNISEVGMPVDNVKEFHDKITESLGEKLWWGNLETFAAIGDQNGLFIVATKNRNWFPTDKPCNEYPLTVKIKRPENESEVFKNSSYYIISK